MIFYFRHPPFTIQRVCELLFQPEKMYKSLGKYLRALERALLVTSTSDQYLENTFTDSSPSNPNANVSDNTLRLATTPLFSPIPFLHPEMDPITGQVAASSVNGAISAPSPMMLDEDVPTPPSPRLGLVDELDDPSPEGNHMSDHPKALSSTTTPSPSADRGGRMVVEGSNSSGSADLSLYGYSGGLGLGFGPAGGSAASLEDRFVRSSTPEPDIGRGLAEREREANSKEEAQKKAGLGTSIGVQDDAEDMVLDDDTLGLDKENIG